MSKSKKRRDARYLAVGMHEYGHAQNAERSRYPKLRAVGTNVSDRSSLSFGSVAGLLGRGRFGAMGGAAIGAGVSGLTSLPLLIEEHQATKNSLKALREHGDLSEEEYREAKKSLKSAYRSYVSNALNRSAISGSIASGNVSTAVGLLGTSGVNAMYTNKRLNEDLANIRGSKKDIKDMERMRKRLGLKAERYYTPQKGKLPKAYYAPPHAHVQGVISKKDYYNMLNERASGKVKKSVLKRGAVFLPHHEKQSSFTGLASATRHIRNATSGARNVASNTGRSVRNLAEDAVNFTTDGPWHQGRRFMTNYANNNIFRKGVNTYAQGKVMGAANKVQNSPFYPAVKQGIDLMF